MRLCSNSPPDFGSSVEGTGDAALCSPLQVSPHPPLPANLGVLTHPSPASRARRPRDSDLPPGHVSPRPWAGCSALLGEGAGAPPHPGAGRSFPRAPRRSPPSSRHTRCAPGRRGEPRGGASRPAATGGLSPAGVRRPVFCLPLTDPASRQQVATFTSAPCQSGLTNGVRGRGPRISGSTAGGAAPYVSAWGPFLRGHPLRDPYVSAQRPILR